MYYLASLEKLDKNTRILSTRIWYDILPGTVCKFAILFLRFLLNFGVDRECKSNIILTEFCFLEISSQDTVSLLISCILLIGADGMMCITGRN